MAGYVDFVVYHVAKGYEEAQRKSRLGSRPVSAPSAQRRDGLIYSGAKPDEGDRQQRRGFWAAKLDLPTT
jgi:hypothetical protein